MRSSSTSARCARRPIRRRRWRGRRSRGTGRHQPADGDRRRPSGCTPGGATLAPRCVLAEAQGLAIEQRMVRAEFVFLMGGEVQDEVEEAAHAPRSRRRPARERRPGGAARRDAGDVARRGPADRRRHRRGARCRARGAAPPCRQAFDRRRFLLRPVAERARIDPARRLQGRRRRRRLAGAAGGRERSRGGVGRGASGGRRPGRGHAPIAAATWSARRRGYRRSRSRRCPGSRPPPMPLVRAATPAARTRGPRRRPAPRRTRSRPSDYDAGAWTPRRRPQRARSPTRCGAGGGRMSRALRSFAFADCDRGRDRSGGRTSWSCRRLVSASAVATAEPSAEAEQLLDAPGSRRLRRASRGRP